MSGWVDLDNLTFFNMNLASKSIAKQFFNQIRQSLSFNDTLGLEHYKGKLERCIPVVPSILLCISNGSHFNTATQNENQQLQPEGQTLVTLRSLVERLIVEMEVELEKVRVALETASVEESMLFCSYQALAEDLPIKSQKFK